LTRLAVRAQRQPVATGVQTLVGTAGRTLTAVGAGQPGQASVRSRPAERYTVRVAVAGGVVGDSQSGTGIRPTISRPGSLPGLGLTTTVSAWPGMMPTSP